MRLGCCYNNDYRLAVNRIWFNFRHDLRLTGIGHRIGNAVHGLKENCLIYADNFPVSRLLCQRTAAILRIGIGNDGPGVFL